MGSVARILAFRLVLVFLGGTLVGSLVPEPGNALAYTLGLPDESGHLFNPLFLALGIVGIVLACAVGYKKHR